jgi:hypothetical protein
MVVEMDRLLRRHLHHNSNALFATNRMTSRPEGGISSGLLAWLALLQAPVRLQ